MLTFTTLATFAFLRRMDCCHFAAGNDKPGFTFVVSHDTGSELAAFEGLEPPSWRAVELSSRKLGAKITKEEK